MEKARRGRCTERSNLHADKGHNRLAVPSSRAHVGFASGPCILPGVGATDGVEVIEFNAVALDDRQGTESRSRSGRGEHATHGMKPVKSTMPMMAIGRRL